jgi:hypothetical protein
MMVITSSLQGQPHAPFTQRSEVPQLTWVYLPCKTGVRTCIQDVDEASCRAWNVPALSGWNLLVSNHGMPHFPCGQVPAPLPPLTISYHLSNNPPSTTPRLVTR